MKRSPARKIVSKRPGSPPLKVPSSPQTCGASRAQEPSSARCSQALTKCSSHVNSQAVPAVPEHGFSSDRSE